jgi:hypothetical protein
MLSTPGNGTLCARVDRSDQAIQYALTFGALEREVTQSHIHFERATNPGRPADVTGGAAIGVQPDGNHDHHGHHRFGYRPRVRRRARHPRSDSPRRS